MSQLYRNSSYLNGKRIFGNYSIRVLLPKSRITIPLGHKDKRKANAVQVAVNQIERDAVRYPDKDYTQDIYTACSYSPKVEVQIYKFEKLFMRMIRLKAKDEVISERTKEIIIGKKNSKGVTAGGIYPMFLKDIFGRLDIRDVSNAHKDKLIDKLNKGYMKSGIRQQYSTSSINMVFRNLNTFLNWLVEEQYLDRVPFRLKQKKVSELGQKKWIKPSVFDEICSFAHISDIAYFKIAYHTGLRLRELRTIELIKSSSSIKLYHTLKREEGCYWIVVNGKGGKVKEIPLMDSLMKYYKIMISNPKCSRTITKNFKTACRLAGYEHFHFHNLRTSFISNLAINNTNPKVIKELARHSDLKITSQHYLADDEMNKNLLETWMKDNEILV